MKNYRTLKSTTSDKNLLTKSVKITQWQDINEILEKDIQRFPPLINHDNKASRKPDLNVKVNYGK